MAECESVIQLRQLCYRIEDHVILDGVDLDIHAGEVFAVLGMSGSGKTTLLRQMFGLIRPTSGSISVLGQEITIMDETALNRIREKMALVFQFGALFDSLNVRENVGFRLYEQTKKREDDVRAVVAEKLRLVGMPDTEELFPAELSGGMQKRVGVARALVGDPRILLYDEPTSGLDPIIAATIDELIINLRNELGVTEIIVSHDVPSVLRMADRMALLHNGTFRLIGTAADFNASTDPVVRQFMDGDINGPIQVV